MGVTQPQRPHDLGAALAAPPAMPLSSSGGEANVLVLLVGDDSEERVRRALAEHDPAPARIHVVAPALESPLDWLATADDEPHRQAELRAFATIETLTGFGDVEGEAGDADPIQAVEDALFQFPADAILIAGNAADSDLEAELCRFGLPMTRLEAAPPGAHSRVFRGLRSLAGGRGSAAPFVLFVGVNASFLLAGLALSAVVLLIAWAAGAI